MKKLLLPFCLLMLLFSLSVRAQKKQVYDDFSRWSLGVNGGISAFRGDMISFSADKTYIGGQGGLQLGYQFTPTFGLSLTADMAGKGKCQGMGKRVQDLPERGILLWHGTRSWFRLLQRYLRQDQIFHVRSARRF